MSTETTVAIIFIGAIVGGILGAWRGHNVFVSMLVSVVLFPIGWLLVVVIPGKKRCPQCKERIERKALVCRFCQHRFGRTPTTAGVSN